MSKRKNFVKWIGLIGMLALPVAASAAGDICYLRDAAAPSAKTAYLLCGQGMVYSTTDAGGHWTLQRVGKALDVRASATMTNEQKAQLVLGATPELHAIDFRDETHGLIVGDGGAIFASDDGGKTWLNRVNDKKQNFTTEHLLDVQEIGNLAWAAGFDGTILHSTDGGLTWEKQTSGTTMSLQGVYFLNPNLGWAVGWSGTILRTTDGGKKWQAVMGGEVSSSALTAGQQGAATAAGSAVMGGGASSSAPTAGQQGADTDVGSYSLSTVYFRDEKNGWACGFAGELVGSHNGGLTWQPLKSPVQSLLSSVAIDKAGHIWIAADEQLIVSEDGGQTWTVDAVNKNLFLTRVFGQGDSLWALGELGLLKQVGSTKEWKDVENFHPAGTFIADSLEAMGDAGAPATPAAPAK
jgi:photosystem II stability/assembly factor-like uncharacterized protein